MAKDIGNKVGEFVMADPDYFSDPDMEYMRICIKFNVNKPICKCIRLKEGGDWIWAKIQYERFPSFCFVCGIIRHLERFCPRLLDFPPRQAICSFSPDLRALVRRQPTPKSSRWLHTVD